jgi:hypothetical protein
MMSEPKKHHFIPQFLLAEWAVNDGKLWRFTRPYGSKIAKKLVAPAEIGYEHQLYTTPGLPEDYAQQFEKAFLSKVDDRAARAHKSLMRDEVINWITPDRSDWTRFIGSLFFRTPENLAAYKEAIAILLSKDTPEQRAAYLKDKPDDWPDTFHEAMATVAPDWVEHAAMEILRRVIDDGYRGERINDMVWTTGEMNGGLEFLISDALLQHTTPIHVKGAYLVIPISPKRLFVATNQGDHETLEEIQSMNANDLVQQVNKVVVSRASVCVGATSLDQLAFVEEHFATEEHSTIIKGVVRKYREEG